MEKSTIMIYDNTRDVQDHDLRFSQALKSRDRMVPECHPSLSLRIANIYDCLATSMCILSITMKYLLVKNNFMISFDLIDTVLYLSK